MIKKNILCIDDIKTNLFTVASILESADEERYSVSLAQSAKEGLEILLKKKIDIILLDVMMPEVDGFECAKIIKSNKKTKHIPILFITAKSDGETIKECYRVGGDDYINKPFNHIELLARISFHLKLQEKEEMLIRDKEYVQSILDLQENIVVVSNGVRVQDANRAMLDFYGVHSLREFRRSMQCICDSFLQDEGYFHLGLVDKDEIWIDKIVAKSDNEDTLVKINKEGREHIFTLKAIKFHDLYIITMTDITKISHLSKEYEHDANYDKLTQIYNRNMFHKLMDTKIFMSQEEHKRFVFIIFDIDFFKKVNDVYGHLVGDDVLAKLSKTIKKHIRDGDIFARWGGEEFVLVFDVGIDKGEEIAESLRKIIEQEEFEEVGKITCSFGITEYRDGDTLDTMIQRADDALYKAKEGGRNRVCKSL